jgi:hypothetical protein
MKKKKRSVTKLSLNKNVVSKLEAQQTSGGTIVSGAGCPVPINTVWNCPIRTINCPDTWLCPIVTIDCPPLTVDCPSFDGGCGSLVDGCGSALGCTF